MWGAKPEELIEKLNPIIRGWVNYHSHVVAKKTFSYVDWRINRLLNQWARRRHRGKTNGWIQRKYFPKPECIGTTFTVRVKIGEGIYKLFALQKASCTPILRHIKVKQEANPFDPEYADYFRLRRRRNWVLAREVMVLGRKTAYNLRNPALGMELLGVSRKGDAFEGLEPDDGKLSRPVLRGV
jgi:RNA-directed DNA polymerase